MTAEDREHVDNERCVRMGVIASERSERGNLVAIASNGEIASAPAAPRNDSN